MANPPQSLISLGDMIHAASDHGVRVTLGAIHDAVRDGDLEAAAHEPLRFTELAANRWLTLQARRQGVRLARSSQ